MLFDVTVCGWMSLWPSLGTAEPARNCKLSCRTSGMWAASDVYFTLSVLYLALSLSFHRIKPICVGTLKTGLSLLNTQNMEI